MNPFNFSEQQRFSQWWIWGLLVVFTGLIGFGAYRQFVLHIPFGNNPISNTGLLIFIGFWICFLLFFYFINLKTTVDETGITFQFFPFHLKSKHVPFEAVEKIYVRHYSPILDFGGWGLRISLTGKGRAYTTSGKQGIQLILKDGKKILIGTHQMEQAQYTLEQVYQKYPALKFEA